MIYGTIIGKNALIQKFSALPAIFKKDLDDTVSRIGLELERHVKQNHLRGPRPDKLGVRTARLINSITRGSSESRSRFESTGTTSSAFVGTNVPYGAMWENGFHGKVDVAEHTRITSFNKSGDVMKGRTKLGGFYNSVSFQSMGIVKAHTREVNNDPRPFLHPALEDLRQSFIDQMHESLSRIARKASQ